MLNKNQLSLSKRILNINPYYDEDQNWPDIAHCLLNQKESSTLCKNFHRANLTYEKIISKNIKKIQTEYSSLHGCELKLLEVPQAYLPLQINKDHFGEPDDMAVAVFPNIVNNFSVNSLLFLPSQNTFFDKYTSDKLQSFSFRKVILNSTYFHELNGGIHCSSNVVY
ncbi:hypothetical protein N9N67_08725 [Bacteriovoracaceae bacterium]|nr:hypothetical protein [Bacteriovoracaceae bacterium]